MFAPLPAPLGDKRRIQMEVLVVLALAFVPDLFNAFMALVDPSAEWSSFALQSVALIIRSLSISAVVLYILKLNGDGCASIGLGRPYLVVDLVSGAIMFYCWWWLYYHTAIFVWHLGQIGAIPTEWLDLGSGKGAAPLGTAGVVWLVAMSIANGFAEELVMRGYLITRLRHLLGSPVAAVAISTALFASYHAYQGPYGVFSAILFGGITGFIFILTNRLWPCVIAHVIADIAANLLV